MCGDDWAGTPPSSGDDDWLLEASQHQVDLGEAGQHPHPHHQVEVLEGVLASKDDWQGTRTPGDDQGESMIVINDYYGDSSLQEAETLSDREPLRAQEG